ncbi:MAG: helix-turn-helix domain-containing protein [Rhodopseudomonas palustris]|uniref:Helix-turn-helix domain-containing protein n=1 Tax=Rhodopseudomonas palustris TaxID=1076 RepID=A0A933RWS7_RHOPL|nr:helix-turn-helix domain-containing protein [Rhodopseudomonas palustris]
MSPQLPAPVARIETAFDDVDAMAVGPIAWNQHYEQIGRGRFHGRLTQLVFDQFQFARVSYSLGVLQSGCAPAGTWVFGLPLSAEGSLHVRRRPVSRGELMAATCRDDIGFATTGRADMMVAVLPVHAIEQWMQARRGRDDFNVHLPSPRWYVPAEDQSRRAHALATLLERFASYSESALRRAAPQLQERIFQIILGMIPSAEIIEPLHSRARIARQILAILHDRLDDPPDIAELCVAVGTRERTLHSSCIEAFGRSPMALMAELRLNATRRALLWPDATTSVTGVAERYAFTHLGRFSNIYRRKFGELPSVTLSNARG